MKFWRGVLAVGVIGVIGAGYSHLRAQGTAATPNVFQGLRWRNIGPDRGGRVTAVAGLVNDRMTYYMGATGGGVWKTTDAGINWTNISDRYFKTGSVGSVAVSETDPNTVYVGMGEACLRSNISHGDGMYKSTDAGRTWTHIGLDDSSQIGKVLIDPHDANLVYVAAVGHPYGENEMRGVFRTKDGGQTWQKILFVDTKTGAADVVFDPHNSKTLYATTWQVHRYPWDIDEVGPGSGIWKSTDGGDNWTRLKDGLPKTDMGKIGVTVSPVDTNRVWATIGGVDGGIYRSDDAGQTWQLLNGSFEMHSRQYYYGHIFADPKERDTVYTFCSKDFYKSTDGGKTYGHVQTPHGDYHDLWIDPNDNQRMVNGNDGGATVTFDGGKSWSSENNQPTAQFYTVRADNDFPYHVYGAQQDNTTVEISSDASGGGRGGGPAFSEVAGGESGYVVPDSQDPNMIYAGAYWGLLTRYDRKDSVTRNITIWPDYPGGRTGTETKYRFQWTFPIAVTPAEPGVVYAGGNVVFKSLNKGQSWTPISGDLTRNDKERESKGRLEDVYDVVFTIAPSPVDKLTIWAGSDDGLIHITRDGGKTWADVTPKEIQPWTRVNVIEASPKDPATAYAAVNRYQMDDFAPYIYRTHDYGKTWTKIVSGIAGNTFVRSVRQDPVRPRLLFAATETGVYTSFDDGDHWQSIQLNLPIVPVTDMTIHDGDLLISTQGRAFWSLDNITPLEQMTPEATSAQVHLFVPRPTYRGAAGRGGGRGAGGGGVVVDYYLASMATGPVVLDFEDAVGKSIKSFSSAARPEGQPAGGRAGRGGGGGGAELPGTRAGLNRFSWDMRYPDAHGIEGGTFMLGGNLRGPIAVPGQYKVKLTVGDQSATQTFEIKRDPRVATTEAEYKKQLEIQLAARDELSQADDAVNQIHGVQKQIAAALQKTSSDASVTEAGKKLTDELAVLANKFYEPNFTGFDDQTLVWSLKLNNRIAAMLNYTSGDFGPTEQSEAAFAQITKELNAALGELKQTLDTQLPALNAKITAMGVPAVKVQMASSSDSNQ